MTGNQRRRSAFSTVILIASVVLILAVVALYLILSSRLKASQQEYRLYYVSKSSGTLIRSEKRVVLGTDDLCPICLTFPVFVPASCRICRCTRRLRSVKMSTFHLSDPLA